MDKTEAIDILRVIAPPRTSKKAFYDFMEARDMAIEALEKVPTIKGNTLIVPVSKEDFEKVKRVMLDCKPYCRTFYEDAPGEAHWIKRYTPDDGEIYECDHCGVEWQFNDGGPDENEAHFCPKCGFKMAPEGEIDGQTD